MSVTFFLVLQFLFFFNDTATTEIYTLSLHDALPISASTTSSSPRSRGTCGWWPSTSRSEEHTSELQSRENLVCRLLLEKTNKLVSCHALLQHNRNTSEAKVTQEEK